MKLTLILGLLIASQIPKNDPTGIWEATTGSKFELKLSGTDLKVRMVEGSNAKYVKYEVDLKNAEEQNSYKGTGYFIAKLQNGKECRYDTDWQLVVVAANRIIGVVTGVTPDPDSCTPKEKSTLQLDLKKN